MALSYNNTLKALQLDQITARAGAAARLLVYSGTRPANGAAIGASVLLATIILGTPFAPTAPTGTGGPLTLTTVPGVSVAVTGLASWFRIVQTDGTTHVMDGTISTVAAGTGDLQITDTNLTATGTLTLTSPSTITSGN
jgi:hypothetical protein